MEEKKIKRKIVSGLILMALLIGTMSIGGCGKDPIAKAGENNTQKNADENTAAPNLSSVESAPAGCKEETVKIKADAAGQVRSVTVSETLSDLKEGTMVSDISTLSDINNPAGEEEFYNAADGGILWENHGKSITYEGITDKSLPVGVSITYYMDGKKTDPDDMAGKSGSFKIRFDYEADEDIPFMALSLVALEGDRFSELEADGGKVATMGDDYFVVGYSLPGLSEQLGLESYKLTEEIDLKDYFEISGMTSNFKLDYTASIFTNGLISDIEDEDIKDLEKLADKGDDLKKASKKLADGADKLYDGSKDFEDYLDKYTDGVSAAADGADKITDGAEALSSGLEALDKNSAGLKKGASSIEKGLAAMSEALKDVDPDQITQALAGSGMESLGPLLKGIKENTAALRSGAASLSKGVSSYTEGVKKVSGGAADLGSGLKEYSKGAKKLKSAGTDLDKGFDKLLSGMEKYRDGVKKFDKKGISKITELTGDDYRRMVSRLKKLRKTDKEYKSFTGDLSAKDGSVRFIIETDGIK